MDQEMRDLAAKAKAYPVPRAFYDASFPLPAEYDYLFRFDSENPLRDWEWVMVEDEPNAGGSGG